MKECPIISEKIDSFLEFIKGCDLIMRNKPFTTKFLDKELNFVKKILTSNKVIDAHDLARVRFPNEINSLDFLFRALNLEKNITKTCLHEVILLPLLVEKIQDHESYDLN